MTAETLRHDPTILSWAGGVVAKCTCEWESARCRSIVQASLTFATHLAEAGKP